ncbi:MAG: DUF4189 domain-containing protein [Stellaceae bacterium]
MRKTGILMAAAAIATLAGAAPAFAGFGAIAYDQATGRYGFSWNEQTQDRASGLARKDCGSDKCRVIPVPPAKCGALATTDNPKESTAWGASIKDQKAAAELGAMQDCQKHTAGQCKIRGSECNR